MTVGQLKELIDGVPAHAKVEVLCDELRYSRSWVELPADTVRVILKLPRLVDKEEELV